MPRLKAAIARAYKLRTEMFGPEHIRRKSVVSEVAPEMARLTNEQIFGGVWARTDKLDRRSRWWIVLTALASLRSTRELKIYMKGALRTDVTKEELGEAITHMAFYLGWPTAVNAARVAGEAIAEAEAERAAPRPRRGRPRKQPTK